MKSRATSIRLASAILLVAALGGCSVGSEAPRVGRELAVEARFLLDPLAGFDGEIPAADRELLRTAHKAMILDGLVRAAAEAAEVILAKFPGFEPALVLKAQAALASGDAVAALAIAGPVALELPLYDAAQLVAGRAAELSDRPVEAFVAYAMAAPRSNLAARRFSELRPRTVSILVRRIRDALARGNLESVEGELAILRRWAPDEEEPLAVMADVAQALGDRMVELSAVRGLVQRRPADLDLRTRQARLELDVGDLGVALRLLQELSELRPEDALITRELARARFAWRLGLLPPKVSELGNLPELDRAQMAVLLYWVFPSVRYGHADTGTIANDVLDHPYRQEIVRVANLGVMGVDSRLHRFGPDRLLDRRSALLGVLRALSRHDPSPACLAGAAPSLSAPESEVCELATNCGLLEPTEDCRAGLTAAGADVLEWTRRGLDRLGLE